MVSYNNYTIKNNVFGTLSAPISSLATTIQLNNGQGARFAVNQLATLENIEDGKVKKREIVKITAIAGDVLTVVRKYAPCPSSDEANTQGQVSYAFSTDDTISAYIDKEHFDKIDDSINDIYDNGVNKLRTEVISGLQIKVNPGPVLVGSGYVDFAGDTITLTDNATNYVEISENGTLTSNTTSWSDANTKISKVTTSGGEITNIEDWRLGTVGGRIGGVNIHDLTEKTTIAQNDEFILSDSENVRNNKKTKFSTIYNNINYPICFVLVGGGGAGGGGYYDGGGGGGGGNILRQCNYNVAKGQKYDVTVGSAGARCSYCNGGKGGDTIFAGFIALGGGGGGGGSESSSPQINGGNAGGPSIRYSGSGCVYDIFARQTNGGHSGGSASGNQGNSQGGGGGGGGGNGSGGVGGVGVCIRLRNNNLFPGGGCIGTGGSGSSYGSATCNAGGKGCSNGAGGAATVIGSGGGGGKCGLGGNGCTGAVAIYYPACYGKIITGEDCYFQIGNGGCDNVHIFCSSKTICIV